MKLIKEWIDYQKIDNQINHLDTSHSHNIYMGNSENTDIESMFHMSNVTELALSMYKNYEPTFEQLISIKEKWIYILESLVKADDAIQLDIGDYEEFAEILDEINSLNTSIEKQIYDYLKESQTSTLCIEWISYQNLKETIEKKESELTKNYVQSISGAEINDQDKLSKIFLDTLINSKLELWMKFQPKTKKLQELSSLKIQLCKVEYSKNRHLIQRPILSKEYENKISKLKSDIKLLESELELNVFREISQRF